MGLLHFYGKRIAGAPKHVVGVIVVVLVAIALGAPTVVAAAISQSYRADEQIAIGALVSSKGEASDTVELSDNANADKLVGAVVGGGDTALNLSNPNDQVQVASNGITRVIVTDLQGDIASGTQIAPSAIKGVGARATTTTKVIGVAQKAAEYTGQTATVTDSNGQTKQARVGTAEVLLQIAYYTPPQANSQVPQFLQQVANSVAGRSVSTWRIITSFIIIMAAIIVITVLLFSSVHSTITAIGRNPLAQLRIYKGLLRIVAVVVVIFAVAVAAAYMVLRL